MFLEKIMKFNNDVDEFLSDMSDQDFEDNLMGVLLTVAVTANSRRFGKRGRPKAEALLAKASGKVMQKFSVVDRHGQEVRTLNGEENED